MQLILPRTLDEALDRLADCPEARPVAGGTDLFVRWPERCMASAEPLLDLSGIMELRTQTLADGVLLLGATATYWDFLADDDLCSAFPLLERSARQIGAIQVQSRGTWAGNVVNASPAADGVLALLACDATVEVRSAGSRREYPIADFHTGYRQTRLQPGELVTALRVPLKPYGVCLFEKVGGRRAQTISKVGLAICQTEGAWRVAVNGMAPTVRRCPALEVAVASGQRPRRLSDWLDLVRSDLDAIDDHRSTRAYREQVLARLLLAWSASYRSSR